MNDFNLRQWAKALQVLNPVPLERKQQDQSDVARQSRIALALSSMETHCLRSAVVELAYRRWASIYAKPIHERTPGEEHYVEAMRVYECQYGLLQGNTNNESTKTLKEVLECLENGTPPPPKPLPLPLPLPLLGPGDAPTGYEESQRAKWNADMSDGSHRALCVAMQRSRRPASAPTSVGVQQAMGIVKRRRSHVRKGASLTALLQNAITIPHLERIRDAETLRTEVLFGGEELPGSGFDDACMAT